MQCAPKLQPVLSVQISGHRSGRLPEGESVQDEIQFKLAGLIVFIRTTAQQILQTAALIYGAGASERLEMRILTGDADGTDEAAFSCGRQLEIPVHRVHVRPRSAVGSDLSDLSSRDVVLWYPERGKGKALDDCVQLRDHALLSYSDVALVVWDGEPAEGHKGGTVRIVKNAVLAGRPLIWIDTQLRLRMLARDKIDPATRHMLSADDSDVELLHSLFVDFNEVEFSKELQVLLDPVTAQSKGLVSGTEPDVLAQYFKKSVRLFWGHDLFGRLHRLLIAAFGAGKATDALRSASLTPWYGVSESDAGLDRPDASRKLAEPDGLLERFIWSDRLANWSAGKHRDATWITYLLAAFAVFAAVAGAIYLWPGQSGYFWTIAEVLALATVVAFVATSSRRDWHGQWMFHRYLAEQVRYARMGYPFLVTPPSWSEPLLKADSQHREKLKIGGPELWLLHRAWVTAALPRHSDERLPYVAMTEARFLQGYLLSVLENQLHYHKKVSHEMHHAAHRMHRLTTAMFVLTGAAALSHFFFHPKWLLLMTAWLPALAASLHGITIQLELKRFEQMSSQAVVQIDELIRSIQSLQISPETEISAWWNLRWLASQATELMSSVTVQWQDIVRHRSAELPG